MSSKMVAVLGLGMSGVYAAKAAKDLGCYVNVFQHGKVTFPPGAFWEYWIPEDIDVPASEIKLTAEGTADKYMSLQWGKVPQAHPKNDFPAKTKIVKGYDPEKIMKAMMPDNVLYLDEPLTDAAIGAICKNYDFVFQTFAASYSYSYKYYMPMAPFWTAAMYDSWNPELNEVWYNGTNTGFIVRSATLWGNQFWEFPKYLPLDEIQKCIPTNVLQAMTFTELKEMSSTVRPFQPAASSPDNLYFIGKWAEWVPQRLAYQAYDHVSDIIHAKVWYA